MAAAPRAPVPSPPLLRLGAEDVKRSIEDFHQTEIDDLSFSHIEMHAPYAMEKISSNLACYLRELEKLP